jgi:hypothetical protein
MFLKEGTLHHDSSSLRLSSRVAADSLAATQGCEYYLYWLAVACQLQPTFLTDMSMMAVAVLPVRLLSATARYGSK